MLAYLASKMQFLEDAPAIQDIVKSAVKKHLHLDVGQAEYISWQNSLGNAMFHVMNDANIPGDAAVAIEFRLTGRKFRIDFMIGGLNGHGRECLVIVELKQWSEVEFSKLQDYIRTFVNAGVRDMQHPSFQAWSYASHLLQFNEYVYSNKVDVNPCAFLHNCELSNVIHDPRYSELIIKAPTFIKRQRQDLQDLIKLNVVSGIGIDLFQRIDRSRIRPSKQLAEAVGLMLDGNQEFVLIDDQKYAFEKIITASTRSLVDKKQVLIIKGGPGTGKSVIAINALAKLTNLRSNAQYVTPNAAPRAVIELKLHGIVPNLEIKALFSGSGAFVGLQRDSYDVLICDEAHRLKLRGQWAKGGVNQIREIIQAARTSVFFIDEAQKVTWKDIGDVSSIVKFSEEAGAEIELLELTSQFRCGGSDDYVAWIDNALGIRVETDSYFTPQNFEFKIFDNPMDLHKVIKAKNTINNRSRMVAGYCWDWISKNSRMNRDIRFPEYDFEADWNLTEHGSTWITHPESVSEVGCIHTCQGLELDFVGVIIGPDLVMSGGQLMTNPSARAKTDRSLFGYKKSFEHDPIEARNKADQIIRNTYRTLLTRGMKGCYIFCTDQLTAEYFRNLLPTLD